MVNQPMLQDPTLFLPGQNQTRGQRKSTLATGSAERHGGTR